MFFINQSSKFRRPELVSGPQKAFTLAEVLITLAIIGVVAALTIPTVVKNYQKQQAVTQLKKSYSQLSQAFLMSQLENGTLDTWDVSDYTVFYEKYLKPYLKVQKFIPIPDSTDYSKITYRSISGGTAEYGPTLSARPKIYLADGTLLQYEIGNTTSMGGKYFLVYIDVNAYNPPNTLGKDFFVFSVQNHKNHTLIPWGMGKTGGYRVEFGNELSIDRETLKTNSNRGACSKTGTKQGYWCAALIMKDGWQMKDDYPW